MAAWRPGMHITVKGLNVFDDNLELNLPNHVAPLVYSTRRPVLPPALWMERTSLAFEQLRPPPCSFGC
jgi:hypothetical protein